MASAPAPGGASGGAKKVVNEGYIPLSEQIRDCEKRWSNDCYRVASEQCAPEAVSLVGISGPLRNSQVLYGDMCSVGYGVDADSDKAADWWTKAAEGGSRPANQRLKTGIYDSMMHKDDTADTFKDVDAATPLAWQQ